MTPAPATTETASARPIGLRCRPDLLIEPHQYGREQYWLVKDPVSSRYFHLAAEEHAILSMLDGRISLDQLKRKFERTFAPLQLTVDQLYAFLGRLHNLGLLLSDAFGQGEQLLERSGSQRRRGRFAALGNILAIRFPGVDPDPFLRWLYPKCRWLFSPWFLVCCAGLVLAALGLVTFQFGLLEQKLPDFRAFVTPHNLAWLFVALAVAKILHESGHALTCIHVGGQCHEIGLLLLVFTPCLYCDVSDIWTIGEKWRRIAVSAAGIIVEACLAAAATFVWWFSSPGILNTLCLHLMIVCSVSTLLLNGNPLLRYDGYYVLADWLEVPNLAQQSQALLNRMLAGLFLGVPQAADRSLPQSRRGLLVAYAVAATCYRWFVVLAILWFCYRAAKAHGAAAIAVGLAACVVAGMVVPPLRNVFRFLSLSATRRGIRWLRPIVLAALLLAGAIFLFFVPFPYHVTGPAVLQPHDARMIYVTVPGRLIEAATPGKVVHQDDVLARLVNLDVDREIAELSGQCKQQRVQLKNARLRVVDDPRVAGEIPWSESTLADLESRLHQREHDRESLTLRAPVDGAILPPPVLGTKAKAPRQLRAWEGTPLDERNADSTLEKGTLLCMVGQPGAVEAFVVVDQSDVNFLFPGQKVRLWLDETPGEVLCGTIAELSNLDLKIVPRELVQGSDIPVRVDDKGVPHPLTTSYQARVVLDALPDVPLLPGARGRAKIAVEPQSLVQRLYRFMQQTFNVRN